MPGRDGQRSRRTGPGGHRRLSEVVLGPGYPIGVVAGVRRAVLLGIDLVTVAGGLFGLAHRLLLELPLRIVLRSSLLGSSAGTASRSTLWPNQSSTRLSVPSGCSSLLMAFFSNARADSIEPRGTAFPAATTDQRDSHATTPRTRWSAGGDPPLDGSWTSEVRFGRMAVGVSTKRGATV